LLNQIDKKITGLKDGISVPPVQIPPSHPNISSLTNPNSPIADFIETLRIPDKNEHEDHPDPMSTSLLLPVDNHHKKDHHSHGHDSHHKPTSSQLTERPSASKRMGIKNQSTANLPPRPEKHLHPVAEDEPKRHKPTLVPPTLSKRASHNVLGQIKWKI